MKIPPPSAKSRLPHSHSGFRSDEDVFSQLIDSAQKGELVVIIGTGVSMALTDRKITALSWKGLIHDGFAYGVKKGKITAIQNQSWKVQLDSSDIDELLGAAEFLGRKLDAPHGDLYAHWLKNVFETVKPANKEMENAISAMHASGISLCTLNYDFLLERITGLPAVNLSDTIKVTAWMRRESPSILHLHGSWDAPVTCILGIRDYEAIVGNDMRDLIQRSLGSFKRLLFIGCGNTFTDPNFSALIKWLREKMKTAVPLHYALVTEKEVADRHADPAWHGFVEPLSYGADHSDLPTFLLKCFSTPSAVVMKKKPGKAKPSTIIVEHRRLLEDYRAFLLKDCGQMTIEGMRADMDTAQRRFDLERLFVPLKVLPCLPEIPASDPERDQKLLKWEKENNQPLSFGNVFSKHPRLALLALPGGGKTILLKRLVVAYADPSRRKTSEDALPKLELTPVLIRCREWREHIRRPIFTLLQNIAEITGQTALTGLSDALLPLLKKGRILLLVDGLDEIHNDGDRSTFTDHLEAFLDEYKLTRLVVTSREAGFSLVAPCISRFCEPWRVAPLDQNAITSLCNYWHHLMIGDSPEAISEGQEVAQHLLRNSSLRRLAENPLLLTMLLVVKHGAGRLPPDRVSLYERAVEVLLDTWNIKGHNALNLKEAIPQLACVAFQLMRAGNQTATEKELLALLEDARERVPQIRRYAKDTPYEFLKRVELRSSLLLQAGHQMEGGRMVPFYQFRHLTFQEYLAAVAAVEGHYMEYHKIDTPLTPLVSYLTTEEWKEVIPMAAVLARKQAEPLMAALVAGGNSLREDMESKGNFVGKEEWLNNSKLPAPVARLMQCLVEEAEATPETLTASLRLIAFFGRGCRFPVDWTALIRGPYGDELLHQAWLLYAPMQWSDETWLRNTNAALAALRYPVSYWGSHNGQAELKRLFRSQSGEEIARGLLTCAGLLWNDISLIEINSANSLHAVGPHISEVEQNIFRDDPAIWGVATWTWALTRSRQKLVSPPSVLVLDRFLSLWLSETHKLKREMVAYVLSEQLGLLRDLWRPNLTEFQVTQVRHAAEENSQFRAYNRLASGMIAFHARNVWSEVDLAAELVAIKKLHFRSSEHEGGIKLDFMLGQIRKSGEKRPQSKKLKQQKL